MRALVLERRAIGTVTVDLCGGCQALWFDAFESIQRTPGATLELFRAIHAAGVGERRALPARMRCPRCGESLQLTHDLQRSTHFSYHRCPYGHGRFTPFFQFLREKNFVRPLAPDELARLTACAYCHAPIAILDPDAVAKTLAELAAAQPKPAIVDVDSLALQFAAAQRADAARQRASGEASYDLMGAGFEALFMLWQR